MHHGDCLLLCESQGPYPTHCLGCCVTWTNTANLCSFMDFFSAIMNRAHINLHDLIMQESQGSLTPMCDLVEVDL